ncbi:MAG: T9SS type A sorting domain-containing protein [Candidatus Kapaibacterium sp.]
MRTLLTLLCCVLAVQSVAAQHILPTRLLRLSEYNLAKIGIRITDNGITVIEKSPQGKPSASSRKLLLTSNTISVTTAKKNDLHDARGYAPIFVVNTFHNGSTAYFRSIGDTQKYSLPDSLRAGSTARLQDAPWANSLICIAVDFTVKSKTPGTNTAYLWYQPTTEFIDALPQDEAELIWSETILGDRGTITSSDGNYTDSWRSMSEILTPTLYPNPVRDSKATLEFTLQSPTSLAIILYDITGNTIRELYPPSPYGQGKHTLDLPLGSLSDGMYLLAIIPENRQPIVQRLMIAR